MKSHFLFNSLVKAALGLTGIAIASLISSSQKATAEWGGNPTCPGEGNTNAMATATCLATPEIMEIRFYELGFCTSAPLAGANFSRATCETAWESSGGEIVDLATLTFKGLSTGTTYKVPNGTYPHGYAIISTQMGLKAKVYFNNKTYHTQDIAQNTFSEDASNYDKNNFRLQGLAGNNDCQTSPSTATAGYGTTKAYLTNDALVTATNEATCDASTKMVGSIQLETPIIMNSQTRGYTLTWMVQDIGFWVNRNGNTANPGNFGNGTFLPIFTTK